MSARDMEPWHLPHMQDQPNDAAYDDAILANREWAEHVMGCTLEQQQAARDAMDWFTEHPLLTAIVAVAVFALSAMASRYYPNGWWQ